jgi:hypothetical protein
LAFAGVGVGLLVVLAVALIVELDVPWWLTTTGALLVLAIGLGFWGRLWWPIPRWRVDERVRKWEKEARDRVTRAP